VKTDFAEPCGTNELGTSCEVFTVSRLAIHPPSDSMRTSNGNAFQRGGLERKSNASGETKPRNRSGTLHNAWKRTAGGSEEAGDLEQNIITAAANLWEASSPTSSFSAKHFNAGKT